MQEMQKLQKSREKSKDVDIKNCQSFDISHDEQKTIEIFRTLKQCTAISG